MANYVSVVVSNDFKVKEDSIDNVRRAISYFEESYVSEIGDTFIGSYENMLSDSILVVIDKRTNKVLASYDSDNYDISDVIEENGSYIEDNLEKANIVSEDEYDINDFEEIDFCKYIQSVLEDDSYAFIKEVGHEKLRYAVGCGVLITKDTIKWLDLDNIANCIVKGEAVCS